MSWSLGRARGPLAAVTSGILLSLAFPNANLICLAFVALVPLLVWLHRTAPGPTTPPGTPEPAGRFWIPWLTGLVFNVLLFWWLVRLPAAAMTLPWIIFPALLALGLYLGFFVALFGWIARFIRRRVGWSPLVVAPAAWGAAEWLKSSGPLGCPWGNVSYALAEHPAWIQGASLVGAPGLSVWIVAVNALVAGAWVTRRWPARVLLLLLACGLVAGPVLWGKERIRAHRPGTTVRVALAQPNISSDEKWDAAHQEKSIRTLSRLSREAAEQMPKPDLLVWPETSLPFYLRLEAPKL
ncbi:MAG TPA: apolipoprotein N-acyltransferase, partial [Candidatus Polarisedimenticolia bacterium]|nr:apolipoprotein N-acyltransferase [Candidatus Polarisedimenticolia bacterium]